MSRILVMSLLLSAAASAASTRVISCYGEKAPNFRQGYRLNILENSGAYKAVLSDGYTTQNSTYTWKVDVRTSRSAVWVRNLNKTMLNLGIDKKAAPLSINGHEGYSTLVKLEFEITPFGHPTKKYEIEGRAACQLLE